MTYTAFLKGLHLRHFAPHELVGYGGSVRSGVRNSLPPEGLWPKIVPASP